MTQEKDIVLIYFEGKPLIFARIESITPDSKPNWYHVKLLMLQIPVRVVVWILRDVYINGEEFTMDGNRMRLERVTCPGENRPIVPRSEPPPSGKKETGGAKVISLTDAKK
jgi:hypothetical protein